MNDQFAIGNFKAMETYMSLYDEIIDMLNEGIILHPETLLLTYLNRNSMNIQRFYYLYSLKKGTVGSPHAPLPLQEPTVCSNLQFLARSSRRFPIFEIFQINYIHGM